LTHGWSFVAACRAVRDSSFRVGARLVDGLGRTTATGEEDVRAGVGVAITAWLGLAEAGAS